MTIVIAFYDNNIKKNKHYSNWSPHLQNRLNYYHNIIIKVKPLD